MTRTYLGYTIDLAQDAEGWSATVRWNEIEPDAILIARGGSRERAYGAACIAIEDHVREEWRKRPPANPADIPMDMQEHGAPHDYGL